MIWNELMGFWLVSQNNSLFPPVLNQVNFFPTIFDIVLFIFGQQTAIFKNSSWYTAPISYRSHVIQERSTIHLKFHHSSHKQANTISFTAPAFLPVIGLCNTLCSLIWWPRNSELTLWSLPYHISWCSSRKVDSLNRISFKVNSKEGCRSQMFAPILSNHW